MVRRANDAVPEVNEQPMFACLDVNYRTDGTAKASAVLFADWGDATAHAEFSAEIPTVAPYEPGQFYRRELPCLLAVLAQITPLPELIIIDGYVWLDATHKPGLGAHLYEALGKKTPVIGVAKTPFASAAAIAITRGTSSQPLFVTAVGMPEHEAANHIASMHGPHRLPTLLKRVDQLCRGNITH
jgi:deoxyribonuclease V